MLKRLTVANGYRKVSDNTVDVTVCSVIHCTSDARGIVVQQMCHGLHPQRIVSWHLLYASCTPVNADYVYSRIKPWVTSAI